MSAKHSSLRLFKRAGLLAMARAAQRQHCVVLTYHGVLPAGRPASDFLDHNFVSADVFESQLRHLARYYRPLSLRTLVEYYEAGERPPARAVVITFDDGFANNASVALPLLRQYGFPCTVFLTTGLVGNPEGQLWTERVKRAIYLCPLEAVTLTLRDHHEHCRLVSQASRADAARRVLQRLKRQPPDERDAAVSAIEAVCGRPPLMPGDEDRYAFLTWDHVRAMAAVGVEFGSHTHTHPILSTVAPSSLVEELSLSKNRIEAQLGRPCDFFAYPNGSDQDFGQREKDALKRIGYRAAVSLRGRLNGQRPDLYEIDRINVGRHHAPIVFEADITGALGLARRARRGVLRQASDARTPRRDAKV